MQFTDNRLDVYNLRPGLLDYRGMTYSISLGWSVRGGRASRAAGSAWRYLKAAASAADLSKFNF